MPFTNTDAFAVIQGFDTVFIIPQMYAPSINFVHFTR